MMSFMFLCFESIWQDLTFEERSVQIVDRKDQVLWNKVIPLVKVLWMNHGREEATWEREDQMQT